MECNLPQFSIITGVNGSGKTQLLQAIQNLSVKVENISTSNEIKHYNWSSFSPQITETSSPASSQNNRENALKNLIQSRATSRNQIIEYFSSHNIKGNQNLESFDWLISVNEETLTQSLSACTRNAKPISNAKPLAVNYLSQRNGIEQNFIRGLRAYGNLVHTLREIESETGKKPLQHTETELEAILPGFWSQGDMLQLQLGEWFSSWHGAREYNKINKYYSEHEKDKTCKFLTDAEFNKRYGPEPWILTNKILAEAGVRYRFNKPEGNFHKIHSTFQLKLTDPEDGIEIPAQNLSSGEKVILAITLLLFQTTEKALMTTLPKLLLLDEVDAPLHPSFTKILIRILNEEIVKRCGVSIIMTTHSPSTVALAPEGSVFELVRKPRQLRPISASAATQILSSGFIVLAPTDIIVITESGTDIGYYEATYKGLCAENLVTRFPALKFIPASKSKKENANGGCTQVRNWAPKLADLNVGRFKGLVDMDSGVREDEVVTVLKRYSWENYLFDPLTLLGFIIHRGISLPLSASIVIPPTVHKLSELTEIQIQGILNEFMKWLAGECGMPELAGDERVICNYIGWSDLRIPAWYIVTQGHYLESKIREILNKLGAKENRGALIKKDNYEEFIAFQSVTAPKLLSKDLIFIFERLRVLPAAERYDPET